MLNKLTKKNLTDIKKIVENKINRETNIKDYIIIIRELRKRKGVGITKKTLFKLVNDIVNEIELSELKQVVCKTKMEGFSKKNSVVPVNISNIFGSSKEDIKYLFNRKATIKSHYIFLDIDNTDTDIFDVNNTIVKWGFQNSGIYGKGFVTSIGEIENVIGMRINRVNIPKNWVSQFLVNVTKSQNILIHEFASQSFITNGRRFHFYLMRMPGFPSFSEPTHARRNSIEYNISNGGYYMFQKPINNFSSITISFAEGTSIVPFPRSDLYFSVGSPGVTIGNPTTIITNGYHFLTDQDIIKIRDFTTADPTGDASVINQFNSKDGHVITRISDNSFTIPIDSSGITLSTQVFKLIMAICITKKIVLGLELFTLR